MEAPALNRAWSRVSRASIYAPPSFGSEACNNLLVGGVAETSGGALMTVNPATGRFDPVSLTPLDLGPAPAYMALAGTFLVLIWKLQILNCVSGYSYTVSSNWAQVVSNHVSPPAGGITYATLEKSDDSPTRYGIWIMENQLFD